MANPPITIGPFGNVPAPGSPIKSDWPQQISTVVTDLLNKKPITSTRTFTGNQDSPTTPAVGDWFSIPAITIPSGVSKLILMLTIAGFYSTADLVGSIAMKLGAGTYTGTPAVIGFAVASPRQTVHFSCEISGPAAGSQVVMVGASRTSGTGVYRVDASATGHLVALFN